MIFVWNEYNCTVSGETYKFVKCEECQQKYVYRMVRDAKGQGNSLYFLDNAGAATRAKSNANWELQRKLDTDCDPVPCPGCGSFQQDMVDKMRREHALWLYWTGIFAIFASALSAAAAYPANETENRGIAWTLFMVAFACFVGGVSAIFWRRSLAAELDPNAVSLQGRLALAELRAQKVKSFKKWLEAQGIDLKQPETE